MITFSRKAEKGTNMKSIELWKEERGSVKKKSSNARMRVAPFMMWEANLKPTNGSTY